MGRGLIISTFFLAHIMNVIDKLSAEQELLIPNFIAKWQEIAFSTTPTDKAKIERAVNQIYRELNFATPIIYYCDRPTNTQDVLKCLDLDKFGDYLHGEVEQLLFTQLEDYLQTQITEDLWEKLDDNLRLKNFGCKPFDSFGYIDEDVLDRLYALEPIAFYEGRMFSGLICYGLVFDYCRVLINKFDDYLTKIWNLFQIIANNCSQIFFYEHVCIVYEKLKILSVDDRGLLHNDGQPALKFKDGTSIYACHGSTIPEQYGKIPFDRWQVSWLSEVEMQLRDILISGIGESKICQELKTESKINQVGVLTPRQKALIPQYRKKWQNIILSTDEFNTDLATKYIHRAYQYLNESEIEVIFLYHPFKAQQYIIDRQPKGHLRKIFIDKICKPAININPYYNHTVSHLFIDHRIIQELEQGLQLNDSGTYIQSNYNHISYSLIQQIKKKFGQVIKCVKPESFVIDATIQDYLLSNLNCAEETERIEIFIGLMEHCGWIYPYRKVCLVCDRQYFPNNKASF